MGLSLKIMELVVSTHFVGMMLLCVAPRDMPGYIDFFIAKFIIIVYCFISACK